MGAVTLGLSLLFWLTATTIKEMLGPLGLNELARMIQLPNPPF